MALLGNPTFSGRVTEADATYIMNVCTYAADQPVLLTDIATTEQLLAADTDGDGTYLAGDDGSCALQYRAYLFNGGTLDLESWRDSGRPKYDN